MLDSDINKRIAKIRTPPPLIICLLISFCFGYLHESVIFYPFHSKPAVDLNSSIWNQPKCLQLVKSISVRISTKYFIVGDLWSDKLNWNFAKRSRSEVVFPRFLKLICTICIKCNLIWKKCISFTHFLLGIYMNVVGKSYCLWYTGIGENKRMHTGEQLYLVKRIYLVGDDDRELCIVLKFCSPNVYFYNSRNKTKFELSSHHYHHGQWW